ncbi:hypothetical protein C7M84_023081 [Penaeus vannamei]|uniref:Uncharacterized protein n=1 Tax=Penaeus vannamei TaxID=6689 RepID=A0A3R7MIS0_PENVA|nr:hypothetical protein C7M84_023081 [Penaeus vannamei]
MLQVVASGRNCLSPFLALSPSHILSSSVALFSLPFPLFSFHFLPLSFLFSFLSSFLFLTFSPPFLLFLLSSPFLIIFSFLPLSNSFLSSLSYSSLSSPYFCLSFSIPSISLSPPSTPFQRHCLFFISLPSSPPSTRSPPHPLLPSPPPPTLPPPNPTREGAKCALRQTRQIHKPLFSPAASSVFRGKGSPPHGYKGGGVVSQGVPRHTLFIASRGCEGGCNTCGRGCACVSVRVVEGRGSTKSRKNAATTPSPGGGERGTEVMTIHLEIIPRESLAAVILAGLKPLVVWTPLFLSLLLSLFLLPLYPLPPSLSPLSDFSLILTSPLSSPLLPSPCHDPSLFVVPAPPPFPSAITLPVPLLLLLLPHFLQPRPRQTAVVASGGSGERGRNLINLLAALPLLPPVHPLPFAPSALPSRVPRPSSRVPGMRMVSKCHMHR